MDGAEMIVPPLFRCPISLDLFKDPVTLSTGQTYDRSCIEKWLAAGNLTCPVTMQKLQDRSMVPNHTLRHLIDEWLQFNTQVETHDCIELTENDICIARMKQIIESDESTLETKLQVLEKVHCLSQELPLRNSCLLKLDFFGLLLELVFRNTESCNLRFAEKALFCALKLMPFSDIRTINILKQDSQQAVFVSLFQQGSVSIKKSLCLLVEAISSSVQELCEQLGASIQLVQELVHLLQHKSEAGIRAVSGLALMERNRQNLAREGAVEGLIDYLSTAEIHKRSLAPMAMSTIENLLSVPVAKDVIINHPSGVKAIVKMVFRVSDHQGSESALNSLLLICSDSKSAREKAIVDGVLTQLLLLLQSQCNGRIKTKARMLLKLLRSMWNE
ncbi:UNVERIFIED_CONTAM: U-box domain-containing protein 26 [Sesamum radiatum]|uniref:U-box domain-containing protein n=1 Tax=Sesamum radiatum TaxID=300843 RepID=A0AAW2VB24_SESRA